MPKDTLRVTVLPDGTLKVETDAVSMPNHMSAERLLLELAKAQGGESKRERLPHHHHHTHAHTHDHEHDHHHQ